MNRMYLFSLNYYGPEVDGKRTLTQECIVAHSHMDALEYWEREFSDESLEIQSFVRECPVIAIPPLPDRSLPKQQP